MRAIPVVVALALASLACDSRPQPREPTALGGPARAGASAGVFRSATGVLAGFDGASRVLTLRAAGTESRYWVAEDARVWVGSRRLPVAELSSLAGAEVTLAYGEAEDGARTTHTIRVSEGRRR